MTPQNTSSPLFEQIFAKSPFDLIDAHMQLSYLTIGKLEPFFEAVFAQEWDVATALQQEISDLESKADRLKQAFTISLKTNTYLPVSKLELLSLIQAQESIPNKAQDIAGLTISRRLQLDMHLKSAFMQYLASSILACKQVTRIIQELDHAQKLYFCSNVLLKIKELIHEVDATEDLNDAQQQKLRSLLKTLESENTTLDTIFTYNIIDLIGNLADAAHHVGARFIMLMS